MGGRQVADRSFDEIVLEWFKCIGADAKYRSFRQNQVAFIDVSGGECTFALLKLRYEC